MNGTWLDTYKQRDANVMQWIQNGFRTKWLDRWMPSLTQIGGTASVCAATILLSLITHDHGFAIAVLLISHIIVHVLKKTLARMRPYEACSEMIELRSEKMHDHSFPSGHTAATWTMCTQVMLAFPALAPVMFPIALFVGWSRMYLGLHYPSDVLAGMIVGSSVPMLLSFLN